MESKQMYCNKASIASSAYDFQMTLDNATGEDVVERMIIKMSPQHAKAFSLVLSSVVSQYEVALGNINLESNEPLQNGQALPAAADLNVEGVIQ